MPSPKYIVVDEMFGGPLLLQTRDNDLWKDIPPAGILLSGSEVAVFPNMKAARAAIARTEEWKLAHPIPGGRHETEYTIHRLVPANQE